MPQSPKELKRIGEEVSERGETFELEDTAIAKTPPPEQRGGENIALKTALNMDASDLGATASLPRDPSHEGVLRSSSEKPLPLSPPEIWRGGKTLRARRRRIRSTSPSITLTKPLAGMGDSQKWKLSVLHKFDAIEYDL